MQSRKVSYDHSCTFKTWQIVPLKRLFSCFAAALMIWHLCYPHFMSSNKGSHPHRCHAYPFYIFHTWGLHTQSFKNLYDIDSSLIILEISLISHDILLLALVKSVPIFSEAALRGNNDNSTSNISTIPITSRCCCGPSSCWSNLQPGLVLCVSHAHGV